MGRTGMSSTAGDRDRQTDTCPKVKHIPVRSGLAWRAQRDPPSTAQQPWPGRGWDESPMPREEGGKGSVPQLLAERAQQ